MAESSVASHAVTHDAPQQADAPRQVDLDKCVHCGLCLNACPTYRELHVEMDSPRGRIYQMVQVAGGAPITESYVEHIDLCHAPRRVERPYVRVLVISDAVDQPGKPTEGALS